MAFEGTCIQTIASGVNGLLTVENVVYILADGRSVSKTVYPSLYAVISGRYGESGDNFTIPDMRGYYLRGDSLNSNRDADNSSRVLYGPNATTSGVGTYQPAGGYSHTHTNGGIAPTNFGWEVPTTPFSRTSFSDTSTNADVVQTDVIQANTIFSPPTSSASGVDITSGIMNQTSYTFYTYIKAS